MTLDSKILFQGGWVDDNVRLMGEKGGGPSIPQNTSIKDPVITMTVRRILLDLLKIMIAQVNEY